MDRRQFLAAAAAAAVAGCSGGGDGGDGSSGGGATATPTNTPTPSPTPTATPSPTPQPTSRFRGPSTEDRTYVDLQYRDYTDGEVEEVRSGAERRSYDTLLRSAEDLRGERVFLDGYVGQTLSSSDPEVNYYLILLSRSEYLYVSYVGDRFIREDQVDIWGEVLGLEIYQTGNGVERTVPAVAAADMQLVE